MEATVAERGQITLPKAVRDALGLTKGTILKVELEGMMYSGEVGSFVMERLQALHADISRELRD